MSVCVHVWGFVCVCIHCGSQKNGSLPYFLFGLRDIWYSEENIRLILTKNPLQVDPVFVVYIAALEAAPPVALSVPVTAAF